MENYRYNLHKIAKIAETKRYEMDTQVKKTTKYQTVANAEEQHLATMSATASSSTTSTSTSTTTTMTTSSKVKSLTTAKKISTGSISSTDSNALVMDVDQELQQEQMQLEGTVQKKKRVTKKKTSKAAATTTSMSSTITENEELQFQSSDMAAVNNKIDTATTAISNNSTSAEPSSPGTPTTPTTPMETITNGKKKTKTKKSKGKAETDQHNISMKTSFSKFDALQKRNLIHVRSSDADKAQEKFSQSTAEKETNCRLCAKPVYKMEEVKAEKSIYHRNCLRCHECNKQLKVDNYQSHEGVLYCALHFKLLLAPKCVEENEPEKPRKPELIIRENQPTELPPDVVRASDKPDLGLEELQQLNVRSRFQVFENGVLQRKEEQQQSSEEIRRTNGGGAKRSNSILTKLAKLQSHGLSAGISTDQIDGVESNSGSEEDSDQSNTSEDDVDGNESGDKDLVRSKKRTQRERPVGIGKAMNDIKTRFEKGHHMTKEERREERKQEIQNIRSRLFMGKQARIKEMYQQAVAESEHTIIAADKKPDIEIGHAARSIKERFEKGEAFKHSGSPDEQEDGSRSAGIKNDADVFESAISKASRSIFMELDANVAAGKNQLPMTPVNHLQRSRSSLSNRHNSENEQENVDVVKYDEKQEDVKIETSEISSKFKFFETYRPSECKKKEFRITPPREGVVKMPEPDANDGHEESLEQDINVLEKSNTTALMLSKFREMEQGRNSTRYGSAGPKPLKAFTPPPDGDRRVYQDQDSDMGSQEEEDEEGEEEEEEEDGEEYEDDHRTKLMANDEALKEAQSAARAKQLRAKFEKWEATERQREINEGRVDIYSQDVSDDTNIESTKTIRERFENMKDLDRKSPPRPRYKVNRFV